jgi:hypothetical protein
MQRYPRAVADVNKVIRAAGIDAQLVKGSGYFYFTGAAVEGAFTTSVNVYLLADLTLEEWMKELVEILADAEDRRGTAAGR